MSLSWGRTPAPERRVKLRWLLLLPPLAIAALIAWPRPPEPPPNAILPGTRDEIQATLDHHLGTVGRGDRDGFALSYDPERPALARCLGSDYEAVRLDGPPPAARVTVVVPVGTYDLRAETTEPDGTTAVRYFRRAGVIWNRVKPPFFIWETSWRWYLSEPRAVDVAERTLQRDGVRLVYPMLEDAAAHVIFGDVADVASESGAAAVRVHWVLSLEQAPGAGCGRASVDPVTGDVILYRPRFTPDGRLVPEIRAELARLLRARPGQ